MHIRDYIEHLKSQPEDVRKRIALGSTLGITGLVFLGWVVALGASGTLALSDPAKAAPDTGLAAAASQTKNGFSDLLGAASAFQSVQNGTSPVTIVDGRASSTLDAKADPNEGKTVIPF